MLWFRKRYVGREVATVDRETSVKNQGGTGIFVSFVSDGEKGWHANAKNNEVSRTQGKYFATATTGEQKETSV